MQTFSFHYSKWIMNIIIIHIICDIYLQETENAKLSGYNKPLNENES